MLPLQTSCVYRNLFPMGRQRWSLVQLQTFKAGKSAPVFHYSVPVEQCSTFVTLLDAVNVKIQCIKRNRELYIYELYY
ncbi:hypothetical protein CsSME_00040503 [Camellia sinensis var. sinensis]